MWLVMEERMINLNAMRSITIEWDREIEKYYVWLSCSQSDLWVTFTGEPWSNAKIYGAVEKDN